MKYIPYSGDYITEYRQDLRAQKTNEKTKKNNGKKKSLKKQKNSRRMTPQMRYKGNKYLKYGGRKRYIAYLCSDDWAQIKIDLYKQRGFKCEQCGQSKKLQVHHLTYKNLYKEEPEDLMILCEPCHKLEHKK